MVDAVRDYVDGIAAEHRPLFDRLHQLIFEVYPDAAVVLAYKIPTFKVGSRRLHVGAWKHGLSLYGWPQGSQREFIARHPGLQTSKGTLRLTPEGAAGISDDELKAVVIAALDA